PHHLQSHVALHEVLLGHRNDRHRQPRRTPPESVAIWQAGKRTRRNPSVRNQLRHPGVPARSPPLVAGWQAAARPLPPPPKPPRGRGKATNHSALVSDGSPRRRHTITLLTNPQTTSTTKAPQTARAMLRGSKLLTSPKPSWVPMKPPTAAPTMPIRMVRMI